MKKLYFMILILFFSFINVKAYELDEGVYTISSALNENKVIDLSYSAVRNGSNIQLYERNNTNAQKWKIKKVGNYYEISTYLNDNYLFDLAYSNYNNFSNIQLYQKNNTNAQKWLLNNVKEDLFEIVSANENFSIDVAYSSTSNGTNIQLYQRNNTNAQLFRFEKAYFESSDIDDEIYNITNTTTNNLVELDNSVVSNFSNIKTGTKNNLNNQKWRISKLNDGYYKISLNNYDKFVLDVSFSNKKNGANVNLYQFNNSDAQKWILVKNDDNSYYFVSKVNGLILTEENGNIVTKYYGCNNQKFMISKIERTYTKTIDDGIYFIQTKLNSSSVIDYNSQNNNVYIYSPNEKSSQKWDIKYKENGLYEIKSISNNLLLTSISSSSGSNVYLSESNGSDNQLWYINILDNNYFEIMDKNGFVLDIYFSSTSNGSNIQIYKKNNTNAQKFKLIKTVNYMQEQLIDDGFYYIESALKINKVIDLGYSNLNNGSNIDLYDKNNSGAQKWKIKYNSNGYYTITSFLNNNKSFDVAYSGTSNGTNVQLYDFNNTNAQKWILKDAGDGYFYIISNCNGLYIDVNNSKIDNFTNIQMYQGNDSNAQKFKFRKVDEKIKVVDVSAHQKTIDWNKVYNSGIYGVILRIGYWNTLDSKFAEYISEVKRLKIPYGIYIFSYASTVNGANTEADFTNNIINTYDLNPTLGIYYDIESWYISDDNTSNILSKDDYDNIINTYINKVSDFTNNKYDVGIYASTNYIRDRFSDNIKKYVKWVADYRGYCGYEGKYTLWQYTSSGTVDGISGVVDLSYLY